MLKFIRKSTFIWLIFNIIIFMHPFPLIGNIMGFPLILTYSLIFGYIKISYLKSVGAALFLTLTASVIYPSYLIGITLYIVNVNLAILLIPFLYNKYFIKETYE